MYHVIWAYGKNADDTLLLPAFGVTPDGHLLMPRSSGRHRLPLVFNWAQELAGLGEDAPAE